MPQFYSDPSRESNAYALPDAEVFYHDADNPLGEFSEASEDGIMPTGWYYWFCLPGCLPDCDPIGPFDSEEAAQQDCLDTYGSDDDITG